MNIWDKQLLECKDHIDRAILAKSNYAHPTVLRGFCYDEIEPLVVYEAITNPNTDDEWVADALKRFPEFNNENFWIERHKNIQEAINIVVTGKETISGDRDQMLLRHVLMRENPEPIQDNDILHLGKIKQINEIEYVNPKTPWANTKKFRVALIVAPAWGIVFPPYNIAKLTGLLRSYGYSTTSFDVNIEAYHLLKEYGYDYWDSNMYYLWLDRSLFKKFIFPYIKPLLDKVVEDILLSSPTVVGFSLYNTNRWATEYLVKEIKKAKPNVCTIAGGPEVITSGESSGYLSDGGSATMPFNYLFTGEVEDSLINFLENLPNEYEFLKFIGSTDSKLKLEKFPFADYSDYIISNYKVNGVSMETSRGCVAQCSFCSETYFWKYRDNLPERTVDEIEHQIKTLGIKRIWMVDSLINGNLKSFERMVDLILERKLILNYNSYARCDGRMTKEFLAKVQQSGCTSLSYGVESGSQKVLHDMRKKVEIWEIENNLKHGNEVGIFNHVNWILGFPTEEPIDYLHSLQLIANQRKYINAISPGFGLGLAAQSHIQTDWKIYNIAGNTYPDDRRFLNQWFTTDMRNTILNRFIRVKLFHIWLEILKDSAGSIIDNGQRYSNVKDFYTVELFEEPKTYVTHDEYVKLDRLDTTEFKNIIAIEYLAFVFALHQYFGSYKFTVKFDSETDRKTFGNILSHNYNSELTVEVDSEGNYNLKLKHVFVHEPYGGIDVTQIDLERRIQDRSFTQDYVDSGNLNDWVVSEKQTKETVHPQYRNKKKTITILPAVV